MQELIRFVEKPRACSYLPQEQASLELRGIANMSGEEYSALLSRGYRRFGWQVFRPACRTCFECRSIRIRVQDYRPNANERRVLRQNSSIRAELHPLFAAREHIELYNVYHRFMHEHRGWPRQQTSPETYAREFLSGAKGSGRQWLYFEGSRLVGVALMDEVPGSVSLVYFFYDPAWRGRSPGRFSIVKQLLYAREAGMRYAYLGYWIEACSSMNYKGRFGPREVLHEYPGDESAPVWI
jgi:arginyl-tRNA--protein-N-Asp/Glu arginylyltransferase